MASQLIKQQYPFTSSFLGPNILSHAHSRGTQLHNYVTEAGREGYCEQEPWYVALGRRARKNDNVFLKELQCFCIKLLTDLV
jgi:hypothetical protein